MQNSTVIYPIVIEVSRNSLSTYTWVANPHVSNISFVLHIFGCSLGNPYLRISVDICSLLNHLQCVAGAKGTEVFHDNRWAAGKRQTEINEKSTGESVLRSDLCPSLQNAA